MRTTTQNGRPLKKNNTRSSEHHQWSKIKRADRPKQKYVNGAWVKVSA